MASLNYRKIDQQIQSALANLRNGQGSLYDIAKWCVELFNASDDYAATLGIAGDAVIDRLNGYLRDFAVDLPDVVTLLAHFPKRDEWSRPLLDLLQEARAVPSDDEEKERAPRRSVKLKQYQEVEARAKDAEYRVTRAESEIDQLRQEVADLRREKAILMGRVEQLEKMINRRLESSLA